LGIFTIGFVHRCGSGAALGKTTTENHDLQKAEEILEADHYGLKTVKALEKAESMNPVVMLDEIDKLDITQDDTEGALLHILDPAQNSNYRDTYLDFELDLSNVLFICTANTLDQIHTTLRNRLELINIPGYIEEEELEIAKRYFLPSIISQSGLKNSQISISEAVVRKIISDYSRQAGLRDLKKALEKVGRKVAKKLVDGKKRVVISEKKLVEYLGLPKPHDTFYDHVPPGVAAGLTAGTGGTVIFVETSVDPISKSEKTVLSGRLKSGLRDSVTVARSYAKTKLKEIQPESEFFKEKKIHMHLPHQAIPKDGPSAGITLVTALLSLAMNRSIKPKVAMTGAISLTGQVLGIGGVLEKAMAARRNDYKELILPLQNRKDWEQEAPEELRNSLNTHFVSHYDQVYDIVFPKTC